MRGWPPRMAWLMAGSWREDVVVVFRLTQHAGQPLSVERPQIDVVVVGEIPRIATGIPHRRHHRLGDVVREAVGGFLRYLDGGDLAVAEPLPPTGDIARGQLSD